METRAGGDGGVGRSTVFIVAGTNFDAGQLVESIERSGLFDIQVVNWGAGVPQGLYRTGSGVVLLGSSTPGALDLVAQMRATPAALPAIVLTDTGEFHVVVRAFRAGASDVLQLPVSEQLLLDRISQAARDDRRRASHRLLFWRVMEMVRSLTPREREVMRGVVEGCANKQIAADLGISEKTVEVHRHKVMRKMEADSLAALVRMNVVFEATGARSELRMDSAHWRLPPS
jgi:FixJ family two-component response regulator